MADLKLWFLATRPWSFPMTIIVVLASVFYGLWLGASVDPLLAVLAVVGGVLLHMMVNVLNDYFDTVFGVDRPGAGTVEYRPHPLVHGFMTRGQVLGLGFGAGLAGMLLAVYLAAAGRPLVIPLALLGFLLAYAYTGPPFKMKYVGLGEVGVYLAWGVLIPIGAYYVATGVLEPLVLAFAAPLGLLIVAVLMANNIRDIEVDRRAGVRTLSVAIGYDASVGIYKALIIAAYIIPAAMVAARLAPVAVLAVLVTLPKALGLTRMFSGGAPPDADPRTANVVLLYGLIYTAATAIQAALPL